ncbi:MAG TPA: hypothetical protein VHD62_06790 [Opitutaceae bacterium]|nr:hypothetical protein [Opitutaceae bacterium]
MKGKSTRFARTSLPLLLACAALLVACSTTGRSLEETKAAYASVRIGQKEEDVVTLLGPPRHRSKDGHADWREAEGPRNYVELEVEFDSNGVVRSVHRSAASHTSTGMDAFDP